MKNPTCECGRPAVVRCVGCGRYLCADCRDAHDEEIARAMEDADKATAQGRYSPRERWARRARGWDNDDPIII